MKHRRIYTVILVLIATCYGVVLAHLIRIDDQNKIDPESSYAFPVLSKDSAEYAILAENILDHHVFSLDHKAPFNPETFRTPGYPLLVAILIGIFDSYLAVSVFQIILTFLTGLLIYLILRRALADGLAFGAMVIFLLEPTILSQSLTVLSETFFIFLLLLSIFILLSDSGWKYFLISGLICGLSILVRPLAIAFPVMLVGYLFFRNKNRKQGLKLAALFLTGVVIILTPWITRNRMATGAWGISSIGPYNFLYSNLVPYLSIKNHTSDAGVLAGMNLEAIKNPRSLAYSSVLTKVISTHLQQNLFGYARFHFVKTIPLFLSSSLKEFVKLWRGRTHVLSGQPNLSDLLIQGDFSSFFFALKSQGWYTAEKITWLLISALAVIGLFYRKQPQIVWFSALSIIYFALITGPVSYARYRAPLEPFLFMLASLGLTLIWQKWLKSKYAAHS